MEQSGWRFLINTDNNEDDNRATDLMRSYLAIATFAAWCKVLDWFNVVNWSAAKLFSAIAQVSYLRVQIKFRPFQ